MEAKQAPTTEAKEDKKGESEYYKVPKIDEPKSATPLPGLRGVNEHITIFSYLHYKDLIKLAKTSRAAFKFIMDQDQRKGILHWKPDKDEETKINNYILSLIQGIDVKD